MTTLGNIGLQNRENGQRFGGPEGLETLPAASGDLAGMVGRGDQFGRAVRTLLMELQDLTTPSHRTLGPCFEEAERTLTLSFKEQHP